MKTLKNIALILCISFLIFLFRKQKTSQQTTSVFTSDTAKLIRPDSVRLSSAKLISAGKTNTDGNPTPSAQVITAIP